MTSTTDLPGTAPDDTIARPNPAASTAEPGRAGPAARWRGTIGALTRAGRSATAAVARLGVPNRLRFVTPLGWSVAVLGVLCWAVGVALGWVEFQVIAGFALVALVASVPFLFGSLASQAAVTVEPVRVVAGGVVTAQVEVANNSGRRLLPMRAEVPVGKQVVTLRVPSLAAGASHRASFTIPTPTRTIVDVGPIRSTRGDALGLFRRTVHWGEPVPVFVHPRTIALRPLGSGLVRDFEGLTTDHRSSSDVAFHTLREYTPGDDRRHIHWRSSAKADKLLVREFVDTRRTHVAVFVDCALQAYGAQETLAGPEPAAEHVLESFEVALRVAGSIARRAFLDEATFTLLTDGTASRLNGSNVLAGGSPVRVLDALAGLGPRTEPAEAIYGARPCALLARHASDASLVVVITGTDRSVLDLRRATASVDRNARLIVIRVGGSGPSGWNTASGLTLVDLGGIPDLPRVLVAVVR